MHQGFTQSNSGLEENDPTNERSYFADDSSFQQHSNAAHDFFDNPGDHLLQHWQNSWQDIFYPASFMQEFDLNDLSHSFPPL